MVSAGVADGIGDNDGGGDGDGTVRVGVCDGGGSCNRFAGRDRSGEMVSVFADSWFIRKRKCCLVEVSVVEQATTILHVRRCG